jgi:hypothetical protein
MKSLMLVHWNLLCPRFARLLILATATLSLAATGCQQGGLGDRCNPDLVAGESECGSGLVCYQPQYCPENYCCPADGISSNPFCQTGCSGGQQAECLAGVDAGCASLPNGGGS